MNLIVRALEDTWQWVYRATGAAALDQWLARRRARDYDDLAEVAAQAGADPDSVAVLRQLADRERP